MGRLFTPTVPSGAGGQLNQLTSGIASISGQVVYLCRLRSTQPFILNWWINRVLAITTARVRAGDAASARWQVTLCILYGTQAPVVVLLSQTAMLLYLTCTYLSQMLVAKVGSAAQVRTF